MPLRRAQLLGPHELTRVHIGSGQIGQWVLGDAWSASRQTEVHAISSMRMMMMQCNALARGSDGGCRLLRQRRTSGFFEMRIKCGYSNLETQTELPAAFGSRHRVTNRTKPNGGGLAGGPRRSAPAFVATKAPGLFSDLRV